MRAGLYALMLLVGQAQAADLKRAEEIVMGQCFVCHGADGESSTPLFPRLAGQHAAYIARQLADYQAGRRQSSAMQPMVRGLSAQDFEALGRYFESRPVHSHSVDQPELVQQGRALFEQGVAARGVAACTSCHGATAQGSATLPRLAGQHAQYTERQLRQFSTRERSNDNAVMHQVASQLSPAEMRALASYLSGLK